jgi:hypothetical protein
LSVHAATACRSQCLRIPIAPMPSAARQRRLIGLLLAGALSVGALPRIDAVARIFPADRDQRTDVRRYYASMATSALEGKGWIPSYPTNFIPPPGQAFFIYVLKRVWPESDYQHMRSVQALVSIATILLAYLVAAQLHSACAGVVCAWLIALNYRLSYVVGILLAETNHVFLLFAFLTVLCWAVRSSRKAGLVAAGLLLGAACLFKPVPTLLAPLLAVVLAASGGGGRDGLRRASAFLGGFVVAVAPWVVRNYVHYGHLYPISTNGGTLLALSNAPGLDSASPEMTYWDDLYKLPYYKDAAIEGRFAGWVDIDGKPEENLKDRAYAKKAIAYMLRQPLHFLRNYAYKLWSFLWLPPYLDTSLNGPWPFLFREIPGMTQVVVGAGLLGCVVLVTLHRRDPAAIAIVLTLLYLLGFGALYHITRDGRMSLPFQAIATIPAAVSLTWLLDWARRLVQGRLSRRREPVRDALE